MLAAMLLMSMGAFAQNNEPLEGDVNKDGKVDVADIVKVIDIMAAGEQPQPTKYTWYLGETAETTITESMFNRSDVKPETITWNAANGNIYQVMVIPESWGIPSAIVDGEEYNGWTWPDTYLTVPPNYVGISAQGVATTIILTWP